MKPNRFPNDDESSDDEILLVTTYVACMNFLFFSFTDTNMKRNEMWFCRHTDGGLVIFWMSRALPDPDGILCDAVFFPHTDGFFTCDWLFFLRLSFCSL